MPLSPGSRLGPYEILSPLGAGGMGEVYRARDPRLGREVAIKVLPASFSKDPDRLRRFEQEARAAGALDHPNILAIHDIGTQDGAPYVVSELLEGETLRARLAGGAFSPRKALGHALQIAPGLAAAHEKGIVHRDLKPENIFVTKDGRVKILDFGLAKLTQPEGGSGPQSTVPTVPGGTEPGVMLGTLGYMSPEQVRGKSADPRSDIFSFGAILYEMLSGRRAFHGDTSADTITAILREDPPDLSATNRQIPPGLDRIVRHCLEKDPEQRFQSARDLAFDLEALSDFSAPAFAPAARPGARWIRVAAAAVAGLVALGAAAILLRPRGKGIETLAVLPFADASHDPNSEYLSDGIADSLIHSLSQLPDLTVMSRDSVSGYKKRETTAQAAGRDLKVEAVLKGQFVRHADDFLITAELVDVRKNSHLWGGHFNRKLSELQAVQEEMASQISSTLRRRLSGDAKKRLTKRYTANPEAYQLYLKGQYYFEKRNEESLKKSIEFFSQAVETDPSYALAYAGLGDAYGVSTSYSFLSPRDAIPKSKAAAEKALEIDDSLARPHATFAWALFTYDWNWTAAEREFKTSLSLDPRNANVHHWYGMLLSALGRSDEAIAEVHHATQLDPFSAIMQSTMSRILTYARQFDRAIEEARRAPENFPNAHQRVAQAYAAKGMPQQAAPEYQRGADLAGRNPLGLLYGALAEVAAGRREGAEKAIDEMKALATKRYVQPAYISFVYSALGRKEETLEWLEKAYFDHSFELVFVNVNPFWDPVRSDPRFTDLLRRMKLAS